MKGCRQLQQSLTKWTLLIAMCTSAIIYFHWPILEEPRRTFVSQRRSWVELPTSEDKGPLHSMDEPKPKPNVQIKYDILLNGYMRSGSTLTGMILGFRTDTFYLYEPFWKISRWTYWHGNDTICRSDRLDCREVDPGKAVQDKSFANNKHKVLSGSLVMAMKILRKFYDCQFNDFERTVVEPGLTDIVGGPSWSQMAACIKNKGHPKLCLHQNIPGKCKNASHRVTKVLRLSTDLLADILHARENLKVIHLFRDPRAIINSRIQTKWYQTHTEDRIIENAKSLCNKMLYDFRGGQKLLKLYPNRFKFIYYEDLNEKPLDKSKELFRYLGMDLEQNKYPKVRNLPVFSNVMNKTDRVKNTAFWWRKSLKWNIVQKMESVCKDVYTELGYKSLINIQEYRNLSIASVDIPKEYLML